MAVQVDDAIGGDAPIGAHSTDSMYPSCTLDRSRKRSSRRADVVSIVSPVPSDAAITPREMRARIESSSSLVQSCASQNGGSPSALGSLIST